MIIYIVCLYMFTIWIYFSVLKHNIFNLLTYGFWGIYFPLFLYQLRWSDLCDMQDNAIFNYIFIVVALLFTIYTFVSEKSHISKISDNQKIHITKIGKFLVPFLTIVYIILYLVENFIGSGSFFPGLNGIDIHTYSAPLISYITNAQFLFLSINYYSYRATKKKTNLLGILIIIVLPVITRLSRMSALISIVQLLSLILFLNSGKTKNKKENRRKRQTKRTIIILSIIGLLMLVALTNYRMSVDGADYTYLDKIEFTGPAWLSFIAIYYGYFPISFNNLKINIIRRTITHNYIGLYSFSSFYFGILQLDNLLGIDTEGQLVGRYITHGVATVPTAFWDFYYDFGILFWIPVIVALIFSFYLLVKSSKEKYSLIYRTLYFWYIPYWFFSSFQNTLFLSSSIVVCILIYFVIRYSFVLYETDKNDIKNINPKYVITWGDKKIF